MSERLMVPEFDSIGLELDVPTLTRGVLVLGSSGAGKTVSAVIPLLRALAAMHRTRLPEGRHSTMQPASILVIDPKRDLREALATMESDGAPPAIRDLDRASCPPLDFFAGRDRDKATAGEITDRLLALCSQGGDMLRDGFWREQARLKLKECFELDLRLVRARATIKAGRFAQDAFWRDLRSGLRMQAKMPASQLDALQSTKPNLRRYVSLLGLLLPSRGPEATARPGPKPPAEVFAECVQKHLRGVEFPELTMLAGLASETATSILATLMAMIGPVLDARVYGRVSFDPVPASRAASRLSMADAIRSGTIMCYQPADTGAESLLVGRAIKMCFFRAMLEGAAVTSNRLGAYVADEAHRLVHTGPTGEASYCDVARAFNGVCVLATQSMAALRTALPAGQGDEAHAIAANLATRLYFSSSEPSPELQSLVPPPPLAYLPHLLSVRPLGSFSAGQVLWLTPGRFGIGKVRLAAAAN